MFVGESGVHRQIGMWSNNRFSPAGDMLDQATWDAKHGEWLAEPGDETYIKSLMKPNYERGMLANWISAPAKGINGPLEDFEYVKL